MQSKICTYFTHIFCISAISLLFSGCSVPEVKRLQFSDDFKAVHDAVSARDGEQLLAFTQSDDTLAVAAAWRALAVTPSAPLHDVLPRVLEDGSYTAWFSLVFRAIPADTLRFLENYAVEHAFPSGLIRVLGVRGDAETAEVFRQWMQAGHHRTNAAEWALAHSWLTLNGKMPADAQQDVLDELLTVTDAQVAWNYLYASYRSASLVWSDELIGDLAAKIENIPTAQNADVRRSLARLLAKSGKWDDALKLYPPDQIASLDVKSAVDLVRMLPYGKENLPEQHIKALLAHSSPVAISALLDLLADSGYTPYSGLMEDIKQFAASKKASDPRLYLDAVYTLQVMPGDEGYSAEQVSIQNLVKQDPYLSKQALRVLTAGVNTDGALSVLKDFAGAEAHLTRLAAAETLSAWLRRTDLSAQEREKAIQTSRELLAAAHRSIVTTLAPAFLAATREAADETPFFTDLLSKFRLPEDVEVYQAVLPGFFRQLGERAFVYADSIATLGVTALNPVLVNYVSESMKDRVSGGTAGNTLMGPDWGLLTKLGIQPQLQLEMAQGLIVVELDPVRAPATVSGMARLAEGGLYNGVAFHRVVPNFVIQGGDVEFGDGYGGPDFVIPTEPSEYGFVRGAAGIASAGKDTEGSQYFFMIDRAAHLDGNYTVFGRVVQGMDVVDSVRPGDRVIRARLTNL